MGNKKNKNKSKQADDGNANQGSSVTLRQINRIDQNFKNADNVRKPTVKIEHLHNVALWAAAANIPALAANLGCRLARIRQAKGISPLPSPFFTCDRCETFLQPGINCSVRIRKLPKKCKPKIFSKNVNTVVYTCNFCSHENEKPGSRMLDMKKLNKETKNENEKSKMVDGQDRNKTKRKEKRSHGSHGPGVSSNTPKVEGHGTTGSRKRKRKGWSSLKQLASHQKQTSSAKKFSNNKITPLKLWKS